MNNPFDYDNVTELKNEAKEIRDTINETENLEKDKKRFLVAKAKCKALEALNESFDKNDMEAVDRLHWLLKQLQEV